MNIVLNKDQQRGMKLLQGKDNIFLTGAAGTGKSFLLNHYLKEVKEKKNVVRLASTGIAACLINGVTFNSFFGLGIMQEDDEKLLNKCIYSKYVYENFQDVDEIIVDEISMISGRALALAERIAKAHGNPAKPWGGIRMIVVGDFFQLPPIEKTPSGQTDYCFYSDAWDFNPIFLTEKMRSDDQKLNDVLDVLRFESSRLGWLKVKDILSECLEPPPNNITHLYAKRKNVDGQNLKNLNKIQSELKIFNPYIEVDDSKEYFRLARMVNGDNPLKVKVGALVMTTFNNSDEGYFNGSTGVVQTIGEYSIKVKLSIGRTVDIYKNTVLFYNAKMEEIGRARYYPLKLAWAVTIHKSQGQSYDKAYVDLSGLWEPGQGYVAISRLRSLSGLYVKKYDKSLMLVSSEVKKFYKEIS